MVKIKKIKYKDVTISLIGKPVSCAKGISAIQEISIPSDWRKISNCSDRKVSNFIEEAYSINNKDCKVSCSGIYGQTSDKNNYRSFVVIQKMAAR